MDFPVLKYLDILIGLAVVMLLVSTAVTAIVQVYLTSSFARVRHLRDGLQELIAQIDPILLTKHKRYIAQRVQRHPLVSRSNTPVGMASGWIRNWLRRRWKKVPGLPEVNPGNVIQREEFVGILLGWAAGEGPLAQQDRQLMRESPVDAALLKTVQADLKQAVANAGISNPGEVMNRVRQLALDQEAANPQLPVAQWRAQAVLQGAQSPFTAKVFAWFDNTVTRVSGTFALEARSLTCIAAFAVCWMIQLDSFSLIKRLSEDDRYRDVMVAQAKQALERYDKQKASQPTGSNASTAAAAELKEVTDTLREPKLAVVPEKYGWNASPSISGGIIFSGILVSLGAPFWYDLLKRLLSLRSLLAKKDDAERQDRQDSQLPENTTPPNPAPQPPVLSDQPDMVAIKTATVLRSGSPAGSAPSAGNADADTLVAVTSAVEGQAITDLQGRENKKWYRTIDGNYLWAGATDKP